MCIRDRTLAYLSSQRVTTEESLIDPNVGVEQPADAVEEDTGAVIDDNVPALEAETEGSGEVPALDAEPVDEEGAGGEE